MDNDLGGTDGNGIVLIAFEVVFPQEDPVGVAAARDAKQKQGSLTKAGAAAGDRRSAQRGRPTRCSERQ